MKFRELTPCSRKDKKNALIKTWKITQTWFTGEGDQPWMMRHWGVAERGKEETLGRVGLSFAVYPLRTLWLQVEIGRTSSCFPCVWLILFNIPFWRKNSFRGRGLSRKCEKTINFSNGWITHLFHYTPQKYKKIGFQLTPWTNIWTSSPPTVNK